MEQNRVIQGNCLEIMDEMPENSVDCIVTDPPYGISFMNEEWDSFTDIEFMNFCYAFAKKALKVLKPGGHCLAFSAPRTYGLLDVGFRLAGFVIRDQLEWIYGSGFAKGKNISKGIDEHLGAEREKIKIPADRVRNPAAYEGGHGKDGGRPYIEEAQEKGYHLIDSEEPVSEEAKKWNGWRTLLKPAHEPICMAQKPRCGTFVENTLQWGVGGINIDACRVPFKDEGEDPRVYNEDKNISRGTHDNATVGYAPDGNNRRMYKPEKGRYPPNIILNDASSDAIDVQSGESKTHANENYKWDNTECEGNTFENRGEYTPREDEGGASRFFPKIKGRFPSNILLGIEAKDRIDEHSGIMEGGKAIPNKNVNRQPLEDNDGPFNENNWGIKTDYKKGWSSYGDEGGASKYFKKFEDEDSYFYCPKAWKGERNAGLDEVDARFGPKNFLKGEKWIVDRRHKDGGYWIAPQKPQKNDIKTLKPINVMRWLVRLVCPEDGVVLDPFAGSGTTGIACIIEGFNYILIEKRERFADKIIPLRLKFWSDPNNWDVLSDHNVLPSTEEKRLEALKGEMGDFI